MLVPNRYHHSKKEQKRKLKPQAMRARREALRQFKKQHMGRRKGDLLSYCGYIPNRTHGSLSRNQIPTCQTACY